MNRFQNSLAAHKVKRAVVPHDQQALDRTHGWPLRALDGHRV